MNNPDPVLVQHYAVLKGISHEEARDKLRKNYEAEVSEIPLRDLVLRAIQGMRQIAPKVEGMSQREAGTAAKIQKLENGLIRIANQLEMESNILERINRIEDNMVLLKPYRNKIKRGKAKFYKCNCICKAGFDSKKAKRMAPNESPSN